MSPRTLFPVDDSATTQHTIEAFLARKDRLPRKLCLLHVADVQSIQRLVPDIQKQMVYTAAEKAGQRLLDRLARQFNEAGIETELLLELGAPAEIILRVVEERGIRLLVIGRHPGGGGLRDIMFGSVASAVISAINCPVLLL